MMPYTSRWSVERISPKSELLLIQASRPLSSWGAMRLRAGRGLCVVIGQKREACTFVECYASPCEVVGRQFYFKHNGATVGPVENFKRAGAVVRPPAVRTGSQNAPHI